MRRSNYDLATQTAALLRRLTASGLTRDKTLAEALIKDLDERLCPHAAPKYRDTPNAPEDARSVKYGSKRFHPSKGRR